MDAQTDLRGVALDEATHSAYTLELELAWLNELLHTRISHYFMQQDAVPEPEACQPPDLSGDDSAYAQLIARFEMNTEERAILILALCPYLRPQLLDIFFARNEAYDKHFTEFGGIRKNNHSGFLPTCETAVFLLSGNDIDQRLNLLAYFSNDHFFQRHHLLDLHQPDRGEPPLSSLLTISPEYLHMITRNAPYRPDYNMDFPAKRIETGLDWSDLVLEEHVQQEIEEIKLWMRYKEVLMQEWELSKRVKRGYRSLFYGPPGTGKTLTACLLGKSAEMDVYRVDLSMLVSKYIGETEKNLAKVFDQAENKDWILFFDEADALFGKRTQTSSSNDRYANQEVAYLLQRIEDFPGVIILATNLKSNIDEAFARRFQSMIYFPMPSALQRESLWSSAFPASCQLEPAVNLRKLAEKHEISGGAITNVIRYTALKALQRGDQIILLKDIETAIVREFKKEGKEL